MNPLEELLSAPTGLHLLWQGNDSWLLWDGAHLLATDLDLYNPERIAPPTVSLPLLAERLDALFLTHGHEDHFNSETCRMLAREGHCVFVVPKSCEEKAAACFAEGLPPERLRIVQPGMRFALAGAEVCCVRAVHGHTGGAVYSGASLLDCGYRFSFGGAEIYQPGDTLPLEEHGEMGPVDVLFVSPTEHNTCVEGSARLIALLRPGLILPQHFGTYAEQPENLFWTHGYVEELAAALTGEQRGRFLVPTMEASVAWTPDKTHGRSTV